LRNAPPSINPTATEVILSINFDSDANSSSVQRQNIDAGYVHITATYRNDENFCEIERLVRHVPVPTVPYAFTINR